jgi:hypothetical protein
MKVEVGCWAPLRKRQPRKDKNTTITAPISVPNTAVGSAKPQRAAAEAARQARQLRTRTASVAAQCVYQEIQQGNSRRWILSACESLEVHRNI